MLEPGALPPQAHPGPFRYLFTTGNREEPDLFRRHGGRAALATSSGSPALLVSPGPLLALLHAITAAVEARHSRSEGVIGTPTLTDGLGAALSDPGRLAGLACGKQAVAAGLGAAERAAWLQFAATGAAAGRGPKPFSGSPIRAAPVLTNRSPARFWPTRSPGLEAV